MSASIRGVMIMLRRVVVALAVALPLLMMGEELPNAHTVLLHRFVSDSCELVEPATLNALKEYTWLHTKQGEMFSPELGKHSYVSYEQNVPKQTVELGRMSGFELRPVAAQSYDASVVNLAGKAQCPTYEEGVKLAETERWSNRRRLQAKIYGFGDPVRWPVPRDDNKPADQQVSDKDFHSAMAGARERRVVIEAVVGIDGTLTEVKVVGRSNPDLRVRAVSVVKTWLFWPARMKGLPVPFRVDIESEFRRY